MNTLEVINAVIVAIGIPALVAALIFIGRKLQTLDDLHKTVERLKVNLRAC